MLLPCYLIRWQCPLLLPGRGAEVPAFHRTFPSSQGALWDFQSRPLFCEKMFNSDCFFNPAMPCHPKPTFITLLFGGGEERGRRKGWIINWKNWFLCHVKDFWELLNIKCKKGRWGIGRLINGFKKKKARKAHTMDEIRYWAEWNILEAFKNMYITNRKMSKGARSAFKMGWGTQIGERWRGYC